VELVVGDEAEVDGGQCSLRTEGARVRLRRRRSGRSRQARRDVGTLRRVQPRAQGNVQGRVDHFQVRIENIKIENKNHINF
jgi:hypothetical protein